MTTYTNENNNLKSVEDDGSFIYYSYEYLLAQKERIQQQRIKNEAADYLSVVDASITDAAERLSAGIAIKAKILAFHDAEIIKINSLILQANNLNIR